MKTRASSSKVQVAPNLYDFATDQSPSAASTGTSTFLVKESTSFTLLVKPERWTMTLRDCDFTLEKRREDTSRSVAIFATLEEGCDKTPLRVIISFRTEDFSYRLNWWLMPF